MKKRVSDIEGKYSFNLNEENTSFIHTKKELDGLPDSWFTKERLISHENDTYRVTLKYPDIVPVLKYVRAEKIRKKL